MAFRFRQFTLEDRQSALRMGTDAMLLGSWANPKNAKRILDIGTGCGVLSLMMAQKTDALMDALDIDQGIHHRGGKKIHGKSLGHSPVSDSPFDPGVFITGATGVRFYHHQPSLFLKLPEVTCFQDQPCQAWRWTSTVSNPGVFLEKGESVENVGVILYCISAKGITITSGAALYCFICIYSTHLPPYPSEKHILVAVL